MELIQTAKDDHATGEASHEPAVGLPRNLRPVIPDATSHNLGWVGLQAFRYRDSATNEVHLNGRNSSCADEEPQSGRSRDRCRFLRPKPALFSLQTDRRRHTGAFSGLRKNHLKVEERRFRQDIGWRLI
jgi:hypothetical protein